MRLIACVLMILFLPLAVQASPSPNAKQAKHYVLFKKDVPDLHISYLRPSDWPVIEADGCTVSSRESARA